MTDDGTYEYYYDCENRLTDVNQNDSPVASYSYDYLGRRISKTVSGTTTKYCYDGPQVIAEYENDVLIRKFIYGLGIDEPILMIDVADNNALYYYHFDGLGSVAALSDVNNEMLERYSYDVFGEPNVTSSIGNPYMFTGRRYDSETDNYYYRARDYNSSIGRFLQIDPIGYEDGMNLYVYAKNNPLNSTDPTGKSTVTLIVGVGVVIVIAVDAFKWWRCKVWINRLYKKSSELESKYIEPSTGCLQTGLLRRELMRSKEFKKVMKWCSRHSFKVVKGVQYR